MSGARPSDRLRALLEAALPALEARLGEPAGAHDAFRRDRRLQAAFRALLEAPAAQASLLVAEGAGKLAPLEALLEAQPAPPVPGAAPGGPTPPACTRPVVSDRLDRFFAGTLVPAEEPSLGRHLEECSACLARYEELWREEAAGPEAAERRCRRLLRGLPWSAVTDAEPELPPARDPDAEPDPEPDPEPEPEREPEPEPEPEREPEPEPEPAPRAPRADATADGEPPGAAPRRGPSRGQLLVFALAALLAAAGAVLLARSHDPPPPAPPQAEAPPVLDPDEGFGLALFRHDDSGRFEEPWRLATDSVAAGERLLVTYHLEAGRGPFVAVALLDDQGGLQWLLPGGGPKRGFEASVRVAVPAKGVRVRGLVEAPRAARRLAIFAVATPAPVPLAALRAALEAAARADGFFTRPTRLALHGSAQAAVALDVVP